MAELILIWSQWLLSVYYLSAHMLEDAHTTHQLRQHA